MFSIEKIFALSFAALLFASCQTVPVTRPQNEEVQVQPEEKPVVEEKPAEENEKEITDERPASDGRTVRTRFYGDELWREKVVVNGIEVTRISIIGNATIEHEGVLIISPRIVIDGGNNGRCEGGVRIVDAKNGVRLFANSATYDRNEQLVTLAGNPYMIVQKEKQKPILVSSSVMIRDMGRSESRLGNDVRVVSEGWTLLSARGVYSDKSNTLTMDERPVIFGESLFMTGDNLVYDSSQKLITLDGHVSSLSSNTLIETAPAKKSDDLPSVEDYGRKGGIPEPEEETPPVENEISLTTADKMTYDFSGEEVLTKLSGSVLITRKSMTIKAEELTASGKEMNIISTETGIDMLDLEHNVHVVAEIMLFDRVQKHLRLENSPRLEFLDKETHEIKATLNGAIIERDFGAGETTATGNVSIEREDYRATGESAVYHESADLIVMEGRPGLRRGKGNVECEKILIYPERNRVLLYNRIRGFVLDQ